MSEDIRAKFFLPPDDYERLRKSEIRVDKQEYEIKGQYNINSMLQMVKEQFIYEYGYYGEEIELSQSYQRTVNSYIYMDGENKPFIHVDELLIHAMLSFFLIVFKWARGFEEVRTYENCLRYLLFIMNEVCIIGDIPDEETYKVLLEIIQDDIQIISLAVDCYHTAIIFNLAHEMAHAYIASCEKKYSKRQEELEADAIAYNIVLKSIMNQNKEVKYDEIMFEYTYLAPIMCMNFFEMLYYTERVLYGKIIYNETHPPFTERVRYLFAVVNNEEYCLDTVDGNHLYSAFLDVYDEYKTQLILKKERGKLDKIIRSERMEVEKR